MEAALGLVVDGPEAVLELASRTSPVRSRFAPPVAEPKTVD
jgi:hypothetical protein